MGLMPPEEYFPLRAPSRMMAASAPAAYSVYQRGTGKIIEPGGIQPAAAPFPHSGNGIADRDKEGSENEEGVQL